MVICSNDTACSSFIILSPFEIIIGICDARITLCQIMFADECRFRLRLPQVGCDLQVIKSSRSKSSQVGVFGDLNNSSQVKSSQEQVEIVT